MPNDILNKLKIKASPSIINQIKNELESNSSVIFDFNNIIPMPDYIYNKSVGKKEKALYGRNNWYDWCIENWGTKWNAYCATSKVNYLTDPQTTLELYYSFKTAWYPCEPIIATLARMYRNIEVFYTFIDPTLETCGINHYKNGKEVFKLDGTYKENLNDEIENDISTSPKNGFIEQLENIVKTEGELGTIHFREYKDGKVIRKIDGTYCDARNELVSKNIVYYLK